MYPFSEAGWEHFRWHPDSQALKRSLYNHEGCLQILPVLDGCILRLLPTLSLLQAETEQKENFAAALAANRKALDESRQDRGSLRYEVDAKNRKAEALATELHLTETSLSERQAEVALLKGHERDYLQKIATLEVSAESCCNLQRFAKCARTSVEGVGSCDQKRHTYIAGLQCMHGSTSS